MLSKELYRAEKEMKSFHAEHVYFNSIDSDRKTVTTEYKSNKKKRIWITRLYNKFKQMKLL